MVLMPPSEGISSNSNSRLRRKVWGESHSYSSLMIWSLNTFCNVLLSFWHIGMSSYKAYAETLLAAIE